ncbi:MAG: hypothetical protein K0R57_4701 [Paenibacillaceae bacterium]|jgi:hypothetical protein|nr:hypothetical protein [Paenibacillaceae bacterium]
MRVEPKKPDWYDALLDGPLSREAFTDELAVRIKQRAESLELKGSKKGIRRSGAIAWGAGFLLLCLLGLFLYPHAAERNLAVMNGQAIYTVQVADGEPIVFSVKPDGGGVLLIAEQAGDKFTYYIPNDRKGMELAQGFVVSSSAFGAIPVFMGGILDPAVDRIQILDDNNEKIHTEIITLDQRRYWFAAQPERTNQGQYVVKALDQSGEAIGEGMSVLD